MSSVRENWETIGREVFTSYPSDLRYLTDIRTSYSTSHECMREMLKKWWQNSFYDHSWRRIIRSLRRAGEPQLADNLKAKYIPGELTTTSQYSLESQHEECILLYCD